MVTKKWMIQPVRHCTNGSLAVRNLIATRCVILPS